MRRLGRMSLKMSKANPVHTIFNQWKFILIAIDICTGQEVGLWWVSNKNSYSDCVSEKVCWSSKLKFLILLWSSSTIGVCICQLILDNISWSAVGCTGQEGILEKCIWSQDSYPNCMSDRWCWSRRYSW